MRVAGGIFINYRRADAPDSAGRLDDRLEVEFSRSRVFKDIDNIRAGEDFVEILTQKLSDSDVILTVIGPKWLDELRRRSTDAPGSDYVVLEIKSAIVSGKRIIPVLVGEADMPSTDNLPDAIKPLARKNAVRLRTERFKADCQGLINEIHNILREADDERQRTAAERRALEEARRAKQAEEQAIRRAEADRIAREEALAGLTPDEIRKAEELANWDFVKNRADSEELRDHLARFPNGTTTRYAQDELEDIEKRKLGSAPNETAISAFLSEFPSGKHAAWAHATRRELVQEQRRVEELAEILRKEEAEAAKTALAERDRERKIETAHDAALELETTDALRAFIDSCPRD